VRYPIAKRLARSERGLSFFLACAVGLNKIPLPETTRSFRMRLVPEVSSGVPWFSTLALPVMFSVAAAA